LIDTGFEVLAAYALTCAELLYQSNKTIIFFRPKREKGKKKAEEKKICKFKSHVAAAVKVFWKNTTRSVAEEWRFFQKPAGHDLDSREVEWLTLHILFFGGK
jgi:hypothetical protein